MGVGTYNLKIDPKHAKLNYSIVYKYVVPLPILIIAVFKVGVLGMESAKHCNCNKV